MRGRDTIQADCCYTFLHTVIIISGNGDILSYEDANIQRKQTSVAGVMIGRCVASSFSIDDHQMSLSLINLSYLNVRYRVGDTYLSVQRFPEFY